MSYGGGNRYLIIAVANTSNVTAPVTNRCRYPELKVLILEIYRLVAALNYLNPICQINVRHGKERWRRQNELFINSEDQFSIIKSRLSFS